MKAVVLLSSGLDSTINFYSAVKELDVVLALTFDYGQRAAEREIEHSKKLAAKLNVPHTVLDLTWFKDFTKTSLVSDQMDVPTADVSIDDMQASEESAKAVWVPNRNGIFLNVAAAYAEGLGADYIIPGFNAEEAATFPDNSEDFMTAMDNSLSFSTSNKVKVKCFTSSMNKTEIVTLGHSMGVDYKDVWTCYFAGPKPCGECESCQRFSRALSDAEKIKD